MPTNNDILVGKTESHVIVWSEVHRVHQEISAALKEIHDAVSAEGMVLKIASGFRTFDRQLSIWNKKAKEMPLKEILKWSALPGASRHHWGTDIDVYDGNVVPPEYKVQLTLAEAETTFGDLHRWLDSHMRDFGFFRPYSQFLGGIHPEPWHLSYAPISEIYLADFSYELLEATIKNTEIELKDQILDNLEDIYKNYVTNVAHFYHS